MRIEPLTADSPYLETASDVLAETFSKEYLFQAIIGDATNGDEIAARRYRHTVTHAVLDLEAWVAIEDDVPGDTEGTSRGHEVYGLMLVKNPGIDIHSTPNATTEHKRAADIIAAPEVLAGVKELTTIEDRLEKLTWGDKGLKDIYFLHFLCTSPAARGKGVGHKLLTPLMEKVAKEGTEIGLITHTPENVKYYERYGFRVRETLTDKIRGVPCHYWSMSKP